MIAKSLARAKRPAVAWLETDVQAHADPAGALARWTELAAAERQTLDEQPQETTNQIVLALLRRKVELLDESFPSQVRRDWWDAETFLGLMRLRGVECRHRYAEGFVVDKAVLGLPEG